MGGRFKRKLSHCFCEFGQNKRLITRRNLNKPLQFTIALQFFKKKQKFLEHNTINGHKSTLKRNWNMFGQLKVASVQLQFSIMHRESINLFYLFFSFQSLVINEVDEGTECENCLTLCPGYKAHEWRWELKVFRHFKLLKWKFWKFK